MTGKPTSGPLQMTPRMSYLIALPLVTAVNGAVVQYLMTGERPKELKDYFFPRTGKKNADGSDERLSMPSYMKDVYHFAHDPKAAAQGKAGPLISAASEMLSNKDFYGRDIRNADDPIVKQMQEQAAYMVKQFTPISLREGQPGKERTTGEKAAQLIGITKAPAYISRTPQQEKDAATRRKMGEAIQAIRENPNAVRRGSRTPSPYPRTR